MNKGNLEVMTNEMFEGIDEVIGCAMGAAGLSGMASGIADMGSDELVMFQKAMKLYSMAKQYSVVMAGQLDKIDILEEMNKKLERIDERELEICDKLRNIERMLAKQSESES